MTKPIKPQWADGDPSYVIEPTSGKKSLGWLSGEKPPFQYANWLHFQTKLWIDWFESKVASSDRITLKSDNATWDGGSLVLGEDLLFYFRNEAGDFRINRIPAGALSFAADHALVVRLDRTNASPVTLALQGTYASLADGEYGIFNLASLNLNNDDSEIVVMMRKDFSPQFHYGLDQQVLFDLISGHKYYQESLFDFGSDKNKLIDGYFSQMLLNPNMRVSQLGNFTSAISSTDGLTADRFFLDSWRTGDLTFPANSTLQRSTPSIPQEPKLKTALRLGLNTSGGNINGRYYVGQSIAAGSGHSAELEILKDKVLTLEFFLRSNKTSDIRVLIFDGITSQYFELDTSDEDWERHSVTFKISSSATTFLFYIICGDGSGNVVSISPGQYFEFTGCRLHLGSQVLGYYEIPYADDLNRCMKKTFGSPNGEKLFQPSYSIYNINGVSDGTWIANVRYKNSIDSPNTDEGSLGVSFATLPNMLNTNGGVPSIYTFDQGSTTAGGLVGSGGRVTIKSDGGVTTDNTTTEIGDLHANCFAITQSNVINQGRVRGYVFVVENFS